MKLASSYFPSFIQALENDKYFYTVMEFCDGQCLCDVLEHRGPFTESEASHIAAQIFSALKILHDQGYAHRDVKCDNLILDSQLNVKLVDLEFARSVKDGLYDVAGSKSYLAPEIIALPKEGYDEKCDVWSAGVVLFCMLFNKLPFTSESQEKTYERIISCQYDDALLSSVSDEAAFFLKALLTVNPETRASSSSALQFSWLKNKERPENDFLGYASLGSTKSESQTELVDSDTE